jgi:hypothetical protein
MAILADQIRTYVIRAVIEPARAQGMSLVRVCAGDVHAGMDLENRFPAVCGALDAEKFLPLARVRLVERVGPKQGSRAEWVFALK